MRNILCLWFFIFSTSCLAEINELVIASQNGDFDTASTLLKKGFDPNCCPDYEPLAAASLMGHTQIAELLIENGSIIKEAYIFSAIMNGHIDLVKLFITKGAKLPVFEPETATPVLYYPASQGNLEMVKVLVEHGFKPTEQDVQGASVLIKTEKHLNKLETVLEYLKSKS